MTFKSRRLLRIISVVLGALILGLLILIAVLTLLRDGDVHTEMMWVVVPLLGLPGLYVGKMIRDSWSVLEVDPMGVRLRKFLGGPDLDWGRIHAVRYWEITQLVQGVPSREYFLELFAADGKRLLKLKSTFEAEAYKYLLSQARSRNIRIDGA